MRKLFFTLFAELTCLAVFSQQIPREMVLLEIGTGTWCQYCPGASMGAKDLLNNGKQVAVVKNHNGDSYANAYSNARNSYYAITGYPTAVFDGILKKSGGSTTASMYGSYLPLYNQRMAVPCDMDMTMEISNNGIAYTAVITINKVANVIATGLKLHFFVTQSDIPQNWYGQTQVDFVNRLMLPNQNGTAFDFNAGDQVVITLEFNMNPAWSIDHVEFVAAVQASNKEVLQAVKQAAIDLNVDFNANNTVINNNQPVTFTNGTIGGYLHVPETYMWYFDGATPATSTDKNPVVTYNECGAHDVKLIVNRGSQIDSVVKTAYIQVGPIANITSAPGDTACPYVPITLDATIAGATYLWTPGGETTPNITVTSQQYGLGSHDFSVTINKDGCESTDLHSIFYDECVGTPELTKNTVHVFPNPAKDFTAIGLPSAGNYQISLINTQGEVVLQKSLRVSEASEYQINLKHLISGVYMLRLESTQQTLTSKLIINN
jgi:PKD repeat protein